MQYLQLFFSAGPIASSFTAETHSVEHRVVWSNNHKTTCHFQQVLFRTPNRFFFIAFKGPLISLAKTPLKCLVSYLLIFQHCNFKLPMGPSRAGALEISMLILFPKLEPPCQLRWSLVPLPSYCQNSLYAVVTNGDITFPLSPPIPTVPFPQFFNWNWFSHASYALRFPPSLIRPKPFTSVVSQSQGELFLQRRWTPSAGP